MQLRLTTDYAIRVVLCLASGPPRRVISLQEVSEQISVSAGYLRKVVSFLQRAKIVDSSQGSKGGFFLARPVKEITLYDIIAACEDTMKINRCLESDGYCSRHGAPGCRVHQYLQTLQGRVEDELKRMHIVELL